jgi:hypothetical protein
MDLSGAASHDISGASVAQKDPFAELVCEVGGTHKWPMIARAWETFAGKGIRTVFLSIGSSSSVGADLDIAESLGCPIHYFPLNDTEAAQWEEVGRILKDRKREGDNVKFAFSEGSEKKWILPKNVRRLAALPWWTSGRLDLSGTSFPSQSIGELLEPVCTAMKIKDVASRVDILKIDTTAVASGLEKAVVGAFLSAGYRPALMLINWSARPDDDLSTTLAAGHLTNSGYRLMAKIGTKFLYMFDDSDMYQICSWEVLRANPMAEELVRAASASIARARAAAIAQRAAAESKTSEAPVEKVSA